MIKEIASKTRIIQMNLRKMKDIQDTLYFLSGKEKSGILILRDPFSIPGVDLLEMQLCEKFPCKVYREIQPNPDVKTVDRIVHIMKGESLDLILGIGGGSVMDTAKAVSVVMKNGGSLEDYLVNKRKIIEKGLSLVCIPTTAGTGAEVTRFGVYTTLGNRKITLVSELLQPDLAILIPELTYSLPPVQTAATSFDALSHALETLWNKNANPYSDKIALNAAKEILQNMKGAYESSILNQTEYREGMMQAATKAGIAFNITGTAAIHALSFPLSEKWHVPHGVACSFFFEDVWNENVKSKEVYLKLKELAESVFVDKEKEDRSVENLYSYIIEIKKQMKLPFYFEDLKIAYNEKEDFPLFQSVLTDPKMSNNPISFDDGKLQKLLRSKLNEA